MTAVPAPNDPDAGPASDPAAGRPTTEPAPASQPGGGFSLAGHVVARVGLGVMQLERHAPDVAAAADVVRHALDLGVNHFDTAEFYGFGFASSAVRAGIAGRDDVLVATKVGATPNPAGPLPLRSAQRPEELRADVDDNLRSLGVERLDLVYLRRLDVGPGLRPKGYQVVPLDDQLEVMVALRDEGKIGALGLSAVDTATLRHALPAGIAAVQNAYSLVDRQFDEMLEAATAEGIAWTSFFPLGSGFPGHPKVAAQPAVLRVAERLHASPSQVGLSWLLHRAAGSLLIPGTASIAHLEENVAAGSLVLDERALVELDALEVVGARDEIRWTADD